MGGELMMQTMQTAHDMHAVPAALRTPLSRDVYQSLGACTPGDCGAAAGGARCKRYKRGAHDMRAAPPPHAPARTLDSGDVYQSLGMCTTGDCGAKLEPACDLRVSSKIEDILIQVISYNPDDDLKQWVCSCALYSIFFQLR
jgi:hypothetical protein